MTSHTTTVQVLGPWSLATSRTFWEGFAPGALFRRDDTTTLSTVFRVEADWSRAEVRAVQHDGAARLTMTGDGDLDAAAEQTLRFLSLDVDARGWPDVGDRDPVIADAQARLPGLRPCGFHSPYEAAAWAVLSQRVRIVQAARLRTDLIDRHGEGGAFPAPLTLRDLDLDLPGRKAQYLGAVAEAALEGRLDAATLRSAEPRQALHDLQQVRGLGPFAAELVLVRGANAPDVLPVNEKRLADEVRRLYGTDSELTQTAERWRPFRSWAAVHVRALRELRTQEISGSPAG